MLFLLALSLVSCRHAKLDEVAVLVAEAPIPMDYGPWKKMSQEGVDFLHACLDRDYHQRMTVRQVRVVVGAGPAATCHHMLLACTVWPCPEVKCHMFWCV